MYYYKFQYKQQSISFQPSKVDTVDEQNIASRTAEKNVQTQEYYNIKQLNHLHPHARIPR